MSKHLLLVILDGFGLAPPSRSNAVSLARKPNFDALVNKYFFRTLQASGDAVGLPWGEMGNSEVGHLTIGAGAIIYQDLPRITKAIESGEFFNNPSFQAAINYVKKNNSRLHLLGLLSDGGVHSHLEHLYALLEMCARAEAPVFIHIILDGRDTEFNSGRLFIKDLEEHLSNFKLKAQIATMAGRYFALDRDHHWERIEKAYLALARGQSPEKYDSALAAIDSFYKQKIYDEEIPPTVTMKNFQPIANKDALIIFNFRADRAREITQSLADPLFREFKRDYLKELLVVTMTEYDKEFYQSGWNIRSAFPPKIINYPLARILSQHKLTQLHLAETEKYAHVTFFFNGGREQVYPGEDRLMAQSPNAPSYDQTPEMSAFKLIDKLIEINALDKYNFIVLNLANADMVGHTGNLPATIKAIEVVDECLGRLAKLVLEKNAVMIITADHGNAEELINLTNGEIDKEHSASPVPCLIVGHDFAELKADNFNLNVLQPAGLLADIAPTILKILELPLPPADEMTGRSLI